MVRKTTSTKRNDATFIVADLNDARMLEEHSQVLRTNAKLGSLKNVNVKAEFRIQIGLSDQPTSNRALVIVIDAHVSMSDEDRKFEPIAEYKAKYGFTYAVDRIIGTIPKTGVPHSAVKPYLTLGILTIVTKAKESLALMGFQNVPISFPTNFTEESLPSD